MESQILIILLCLYVILSVTMFNHTQTRISTNLTVACFNVRGIMPSTCYLSDLLQKHDIDICAISEHWLFEDNLDYMNSICKDYTSVGKCDNSADPYSIPRRGKGGVAFIYKEHLDSSIHVLPIDNDRIIGIQVNLNQNLNMCLLSVYLPSTNQDDNYFEECIDTLCDLWAKYSHDSEVVILGDINCQIKGHRCTPQSSKRVSMVQRFLDDSDMMSINVNSSCNGPSYTFDPYDSGINRSTIDHILLSKNLLDLCKGSEVIDDHALNVSDHLPIICKIETKNINIESPRLEKAIPNWKKARTLGQLTDYQQELDIMLDEIENLCVNEKCTIEDISIHYNKLKTCMCQAANNTVQQKKFCPFLKPYWKECVKEIHQEMRVKRRAWINEGRPRGPESMSFSNYKEAKRRFRKKLRNLAYQTEVDLWNEIEKSAEIDHNKFWNLIKMKRSKRNKKCKALRINGIVYRKVDEVAEAWRAHFAKLYAFGNNPDFDNDHRIWVVQELQRMVSIMNVTEIDELNRCVDMSELESAIKGLKTEKAAGYDEIYNEHVKYGGDKLKKHILSLIQGMQHIGQCPDDMKKGIIITLQKSILKSCLDPDNHRGITLLSVIYKLYEGILLTRLLELRISRGLILPDNQQVAYQPGLSNINTSFNVQECISYNVERGSKVFACFLDSKKAFDVLWHDGLRLKLYQLGVKGQMHRIISNLYVNMSSAVLANGVLSDFFPIKQSVRQGGVLSPWLYIIFINSLLCELNECGCGANIGSIYAGNPTHADDIVLLSTSPKGLQHMIDICYNYSRKWRFLLSPEKTKLMVFGETKVEFKKQKNQRKFFLGKFKIDEVEQHTHVGIILNKFNSKDRTKSACRKGRGVMVSLNQSGLTKAWLTPLPLVRLYKTVVLPRALHGCELWNSITKEEKLILERLQRFCAKEIQGFPRLTRSDICTSMLGLGKLEHHMDKCKLLFLQRLCNLPNNLLSKQIFLFRLVSHFHHNVTKGFIKDILEILERYDLLQFIQQFIQDGLFPRKNLWKSTVNKAIMTYEQKNYADKLRSDPDLEHFFQIHPGIHEPSRIWKAAQLCPRWKVQLNSMAKVLTVSRENDLTLCEFCGKFFTDIVAHIIIACDATQKEVEGLWNFISDDLPVEFGVLLYNVNDLDFISITLGAPIEIDKYALTEGEYLIFIIKMATFWHKHWPRIMEN